MTVTAIVPTRNEEATIKEVLTLLRPHVNDILVIDGHSTDRTREIASAVDGTVVMLDNGRGKGAALRLAAENAKGDILVFIDADGSHDPADVPRLIAPIIEGRADMVIGSRLLGGSEELHGTLENAIRMIGNAIITAGINLRFGASITDCENGFRAIKRDVFLKLGLRENRHTIEQEMAIKALRYKYRVVDVGAHEYKRKAGVSKINLKRDSLHFVYTWLRYLLFK